jgi:threonine dehydrogenase-like Zn-dependent dehydrogenase
MATLTCAARGIDPPCDMCAAGRTNLCERTAFGHLDPGLQTGFCADTGGGWSVSMVAHESQLFPVPDDVSDEAAVLIEPLACAMNAAPATSAAVVIGAGTLGLLTIAAIAHGGEQAQAVHGLIATAKYAEQRKLAKELGAKTVVAPDELERAVRRQTPQCLEAGGQLTCGSDFVVDCVGSDASLAQALRVVAPGGTVYLLGMPGVTTVDLTSLWHREVSLKGTYAYTRQHFELAVNLVRDLDLGRLVSATYPLDRYREAIDHAANAGSRGAVKIAFDLRNERNR